MLMHSSISSKIGLPWWRLDGYLAVGVELLLLLPPAGRGGEGWMRYCGCSSSFAGWWWPISHRLAVSPPGGGDAMDLLLSGLLPWRKMRGGGGSEGEHFNKLADGSLLEADGGWALLPLLLLPVAAKVVALKMRGWRLRPRTGAAQCLLKLLLWILISDSDLCRCYLRPKGPIRSPSNSALGFLLPPSARIISFCSAAYYGGSSPSGSSLVVGVRPVTVAKLNDYGDEWGPDGVAGFLVRFSM